MNRPPKTEAARKRGPEHVPAHRKRPKIQDVATAAGVSLGTVSAVLNGNGRVSEATRTRVQQAIEQLGYRPDLYASNLARRHSQVIGVVVSNLQNPFFAETAQAMEEEAARHSYQISLMATNFSPTQHRAVITQLLGARIAGLAVLTSEEDEPSRKLILASHVPSVFLDIGESGERSSTICVDSRGGMEAAVRHLLDLGHRELLFVRNSQTQSGRTLLSHQLRDQGFSAAVHACKVRGLKSTVIDMPGPSADAGEAAIASAYGRVAFTAVIAINDMAAMGVYRGLQARGICIPREISVVGFDNTYFSRFMHPPLTTVDVPRKELSRLAVSALLDRAAPKILPLATTLTLRESTAAPAHLE